MKAASKDPPGERHDETTRKPGVKPRYYNDKDNDDGMESNDNDQNNNKNDNVIDNGNAAATQLLPQVAAALGITYDDDDEKGQVDLRATMADAALPSEQGQRSISLNYRSTSSSAHRSTASEVLPKGRLNRIHGDDENGDDGGEEDSIVAMHIRRASAPTVVQAVPMPPNDASGVAGAAFRASSTGAPVTVVAEPPIVMQAVPVPEADVPEPCTAGVLFQESAPLDQAQISQLRNLGYTEGLITALNQLKESLPLRFWLVDNSGSMLQSDGNEVRALGSEQPYVVENCTRWAELEGTVAWHASLAGILKTNTVFRLLNPPEHLPAAQEFTVAGPNESLDETDLKVQQAKEIMNKITPKGFTPLTKHLIRIRESVQAIQQTLIERNQNTVIVIATDGIPTDEAGDSNREALEAFKDTLKSLSALPVWIVIRLCTDDKDVVTYYNELDRQVRTL